MKNKLSNIICIFCFLIFPISVFSQTAKITGKIIDSNTGEAVFGATVVVRAEKKVTKTDFDGKYSLELPAGTHTVEFQMFGYDPQKKTVTLAAGTTQSINITFGAKTLETVEVTERALNNTEASLLALQKKSSSVSDGISQEAIKKSPDSSAGEVVKRVTGITLISGKYVFVRGLGERYSNTVLNNSVLPSTEPDKRVVPMDIFPANLLKNVRIIKTFVPEEPGEFSGGLVKVETQEYPDQFTASFGVGIGRNYQTTGNKFLTFEAGEKVLGLPTGRPASKDKVPGLVDGLSQEGRFPFEPGTRFGGIPPQVVSLGSVTFPSKWTEEQIQAPYDKNINFSIGNTFQTTQSGQRLGVMFGTTHNNQFRFREEKTVRYVPGNPITRDFTKTTYLGRIQSQDTKVYNEEVLFGNNLNLAYEFTKGQQIYWKNLYTTSSDKQVRDADGKDYLLNLTDFKAISTIFTSRQLFNTTIGGDHALNVISEGRPWKLEWQYNYANAKRDEPNLQTQAWRRPIETLINFTRLGNNPDGTRFYSTAEDNVRSPSLKLEIPFNQWDGLKSTLKLGILSMQREKNFLFREFGYKVGFANNPTIDNANVGIATLYPVPGEITYNPLFTFSGAKIFSERQVEPNAYNAIQKLKASFVQVDMPLVNKFRFVGGLRYEDSYQKVKTYVTKDSYNITNLDFGCDFTGKSEFERVLSINANLCNATNNGIGELRTQDKLPSANFIWEVQEDMNLRFAYSETITRPDLRELSSFGFSPYYGADRLFGNSDLRRTYIHNYDFRWEWYLKGAEYVGVGVFNKQLSNPIELIGQPVAGSINARFTYTNAESAVIRGLEFDFRRELFNIFRVETNFFFIKSRVDVLDYKQQVAIRAGLLDRNDRAFAYDPTNISRPLQGQSEFVFNLKWNWYLTKAKNATLGLYYNFFGDRIFAVGANGTPDAIEKGVGLTDLVFQYNHLEKYDFKFAARNILNTRFRIYQKNELLGQDELFLSYREGVSFSFSAGMKL